MAAQTTIRSSWFRAAVLPAALLSVLGAGNAARGAALDSPGAPPNLVLTVPLEYRESASTVLDEAASVRAQAAPFEREPPAAPGPMVRGVLNFGGEPADAMAFVWQRGAGKLFLDLNRNRDLTDDPAGVASSASRGAVNFQTFTGIPLLFHTPAGPCPVLANVSLWDAGPRLGCTIGVRSFWRAEAKLAGRDCEVGVVPDTAKNSLESGWLLLRPWAERDRPFSAYGGSFDAVPFARRLFWNGHAYELKCLAGAEGGRLKPALQFTEQSVALGELKITGQFIHRLVLPGGPYQVVLDQPAASVKIPVGSYNPPLVVLSHGGAGAFYNPGQPPGRRISVTAAAPLILDAGGPLTNSVIASRHGQDLRLDYKLVGAGGAVYQLVNQDRSHPPQYAIFKGHRQIASGNFEFG